jgi:PAS domain S-box-containing protein
MADRLEDREANLVRLSLELQQASEERFQNLANLLPQTIFELDASGDIVYLSLPGIKLFGYTEDDVRKGINFTNIITSQDRVEAAKALKQSFTGETTGMFECSAVTKAGSTFPVAVYSSTIMKNGQTIGIRGILIDVSDRKLAEKEKQQLRDKAEMSSRLAAVGEMAAGIAHEINNPLTGVIGFSELLSERQDLPADVKDQLKIIADGGNRVKDIVKRMLTFARQTKPTRTSASINELIEATLSLRSYVLRTANIEVIKHLDPDLPWVMVDPGQMQQVFLNLIVNAEYSMKKAHGKGTFVITTEKMDGYIHISFKDDGTGMSQEIKDKLFHPFFTTKQVNEGTGLGLGLSRSIVLEHNGTIEVESQLNQGATFIITLPITQPAEEAPAVVITAVLAEKVKAARILVVDDEESIRKLVTTILAQSGHTVDATGEAKEALTKLESTHYDAVLMDIRMPGMSGMEMYNIIKERHSELTGKCIFITGDTSDATTRAFLEQNKLPYISKPFDKETLLKKVNGLL